jgi:hypothetical protein
LNPPRKIELPIDMPFRIEVERLKRVEADPAAARGAVATAREEAAQLRGQAVYGVASRSGMEGDCMCALGRGRLNNNLDL